MAIGGNTALGPSRRSDQLVGGALSRAGTGHPHPQHRRVPTDVTNEHGRNRWFGYFTT